MAWDIMKKITVPVNMIYELKMRYRWNRHLGKTPTLGFECEDSLIKEIDKIMNERKSLFKRLAKL